MIYTSPSPYIHTKLAPGTWAATEEVVPVEDPQTRMAVLRLPIIFRGSRKQLLEEFSFGKKNSPQGGQSMFCTGMQAVRMMAYTGQDPHWEAEIEWVGLHNQIPGGGTDYIFTATVDWSHREVEFPIRSSKSSGDGELILKATPPMAPDGDGADGMHRRARRLDHVPTATITAVIRSGQPIGPYHTAIMAILNLLKVTDAGAMFDGYKDMPSPVWVTWLKRQVGPTTSTQSNPAGWFPREIKTMQRIAPASTRTLGEALYVVSITATLEQLLQPG